MSAAAPIAPAPLRVGWARLRGLAAHRSAYVLLAGLVAVTLAIGSVHHRAPSEAARITALESVIKCPSCTDESIAQSDASTAVGLRAQVVSEVHEGWSDAQVLANVRAKYGQDLLIPSGSGAWIAWALPIGALVIGGGALGGFLLRRGLASASGGAAVISEEDEALLAEARREAEGR